MEEWRNIPGYESLYQISSLGEVRTLAKCWQTGFTQKCRPEALMKQQEWLNYKVVWLRKEGIKRKFKVHRLVAMAFLPNPKNKEFVNHKDRNRRNNTLPNLEWCTPQENSNHWVADDKAKTEHSDISF